MAILSVMLGQTVIVIVIQHLYHLPQFKLNQNGDRDRDREAANVNTFVSELHNTTHHIKYLVLLL